MKLDTFTNLVSLVGILEYVKDELELLEGELSDEIDDGINDFMYAVSLLQSGIMEYNN